MCFPYLLLEDKHSYSTILAQIQTMPLWQEKQDNVVCSWRGHRDQPASFTIHQGLSNLISLSLARAEEKKPLMSPCDKHPYEFATLSMLSTN
jgi:hypothetical protein